MFFEIFLKLCQDNGKSPSAIAKDLKIASGTVTEWKKGRIPQNATLSKLADYFGVSVDYLLGKEGEEPRETQDHIFWSNFNDLCEKNGTTPVTVAKALNVTPGTLSNWNRGSVPRWGTLYKIAEYFGVSIKLLLGGAAEDEGHPDEPPQKLIKMDTGDVRMIPIFESVSAGFGTLAVNEIVDYIPLYIPNKVESDATICIKVRGDSMAPKIENGDIIQVHKQDSVDSGSIAVVLLDGDEGLVKKVVYGEMWLELRSLNPMYKIMRFNGAETKRVRIVGLVKRIIKNM